MLDQRSSSEASLDIIKKWKWFQGASDLAWVWWTILWTGRIGQVPIYYNNNLYGGYFSSCPSSQPNSSAEGSGRSAIINDDLVCLVTWNIVQQNRERFEYCCACALRWLGLKLITLTWARGLTNAIIYHLKAPHLWWSIECDHFVEFQCMFVFSNSPSTTKSYIFKTHIIYNNKCLKFARDRPAQVIVCLL